MIKKVISASAMVLAFTAGVALSQDKGGKGGGKGPQGPA